MLCSSHFRSWNPDQHPTDPLKILFGKKPYFAFSLRSPIKPTLIPIVRRLPDLETPAKFAHGDEALLIVLMNVVRLFGGMVLPDEVGNTYTVVYTTIWDYTATAALADMFAMIFQEPLVNVESLACKDPERDGEPYRWFIPYTQLLQRSLLQIGY